MKRYAIGLAFLLTCMTQGYALPGPHHVSPASMNGNTREMFQATMDSYARLWDEGVKLLRAPGYVPGSRYPGNPLEDWHYWSKCCFRVRESSEYALGLLIRDAPGDRQRAVEALNAVLKTQYLTPGVRWYGTFKRTPEETDPGPNAAMWRDYDPNWREFIGTTLETILIEYPDRIPAELSQRLYAAIDRAVEGEIAEKRLVPAYTNPSLMYGSLWDFAAAHDKRADWQMQSGNWIEGFYSLYSRYNAFSEFNSPTYSGVDLFGLALWRDYGSTERIRTMGSQMEAQLWQDIASFYQPELNNLSGPYDRAYGMDMEKYDVVGVSGIGTLMMTVMDAQGARALPIAKRKGSEISPEMAILGTRIPPDALIKLKIFEGEHLVRKQITDQRVATAWIGKHVIFGGEATSKTKDVRPPTGTGSQYLQASQFHPVTIQWRTPSGEIGWVRVVDAPMIDATADEHGITISATGTIRLRIHAKDMVPGLISQTLWNLPGMHISVTSDTQSVFSLGKADPATFDPAQRDDDGYDIVYPGITKMRLDINADADH